MKKLRNNQKGFTLIELMISIIIIGILASIVMVSLNKVKERGNNAKRVADMEQIQVALKIYRSVNDDYPRSAPDGNMGPLTAALVPNYLKEPPEDPLNREFYIYRYLGGDDVSFPENCPEGNISYILGYRLEGDTNGNSGGCGGPENQGYYIIYK